MTDYLQIAILLIIIAGAGKIILTSSRQRLNNHHCSVSCKKKSGFNQQCLQSGTGGCTLNKTKQSMNNALYQIGKNKLGQSPHSGDLTFLHADAGNLPFEDSSFDIILAMRFFHLTPIPMYFFLEMLRVAREKIIFDTFNKYSARSFYNWLLPMGSTLHDRSYIFRLLSSVDMTIEDSHQDFIFPYGIYRNLPLSIAKPIRSIDSSAVSTSIGQRVSTVSYWSVSL